jgi:nucleoside phosphorylase
MVRKVRSTDSLHPARLLLTAALSPAEFSKKFQPKISNTPPLPAIDWTSFADRPQPLNTPGTLPSAEAIVITWAEPEWAALEQVFFGAAPMKYAKRNESSWTGWVKDETSAPAELGYWGYYRLAKLGGTQVLLYKSNAHYAASSGESDLAALVNRLVQSVAPQLILSIGTAGGARLSDPVGTVNVVRSDALYESNQPQTVWPKFVSTWVAEDTVLKSRPFKNLLFPVPTTTSDLKSIATQFNAFYSTKYSLNTLNPGNLNSGAAAPAINDLTGAGVALLTAKSFVVANTSGNLSKFACVEMDDAIIARTLAGKIPFGSLRNISDPIQADALPPAMQGHWGEAIYDAYGFYTSFNGALSAWAVLTAQLG